MKKISLLLMLLFGIFFTAVAGTNPKAVKMVSYEQNWLDSYGTLSLKNNTNITIHNVVFQIIYLDMKGNQLDYKDFSKEIEIESGMVKKLDIPAYERDRHYHYYKTKDDYGHPAFKIQFNLKEYNVEKIQETEDVEIPTEAKTILLTGLIFGLICLGIGIGLYVLVAVMAKKRHRNVVLWVLLSLFITPLLSVIILLVVGDDEQKNEELDRP